MVIGARAIEFFDDPNAIATLDRCLDTGATVREEVERVTGAREKTRLSCTFAAAPPNIVILHAEDITEAGGTETILLVAIRNFFRS